MTFPLVTTEIMKRMRCPGCFGEFNVWPVPPSTTLRAGFHRELFKVYPVHRHYDDAVAVCYVIAASVPVCPVPGCGEELAR